MLCIDRTAYLDAFVMHMSRLGALAEPETIVQMAEAYWLSHPNSDPVKVAQWRVDQFGLLHED